MDLLCFCSVLCLLCLCAGLFICALWPPAGKGLTSCSDSFTILGYGSLDSLHPISMSPHCKLMSPKHYF